MKCQQARIYLSPYLDSELDPTTTYEVSRHLEGCPDCAELFASEGELEGAISERLGRPRGDEQELVERALVRVLAGRGRFLDRRVLFVAASLLLTVLGLFAYRQATGARDRIPALVAMAAKDHRSYIRGEAMPELLTRDHAVLASFFEGKLAGEIGAFPIGNGWGLEGARVCSFHGIHVSLVTLRYHGIPVSVIDVPHEDVERALEDEFEPEPSDPCFELEGGRGILRRTHSGVRVAFGNIEMAKLEEAVRAAR